MNNSSNSIMFAEADTRKVMEQIVSGTTVSVIGIPSAGITLFVKQLAEQPIGHMVLVDVFGLTGLSTYKLFLSLLHKLDGDIESNDTEEIVLGCKRKLQDLAKSHERIVVCITGFDLLADEFGEELFRYFRSLRSVDQKRIVFVFGLCRRIETLLPHDIANIDLSLFSNTHYLKPYKPADLRYLLSKYGPQTELASSEIERLIALSGGHFRFLQLLIGSEKRLDPVSDPFIQLAFKNIFAHLSQQQKTLLRKVTIDGVYKGADDYLLNVGLIKKLEDGTYQVFSPLFADCLRALTTFRLPVKERRLLAVLKRNQGRIVSKREIYDAVWPGNTIGSEWALNALVYRLRKHPAFLSQNYAIENHKKQGYSLVKSF